MCYVKIKKWKINSFTSMQPSENFTFLTFNFNNALFTKMWIMSLLKKNELYNILIVDNSTENIESICDLKNVRLFDNTKFKYTKNFNYSCIYRKPKLLHQSLLRF